MSAPAEQYLPAVFRRCGGFVARGLVTGPEFINRVFDEFANTDRVYTAIVPALWVAVPGDIRGEFEFAVRNAARPEFRYHAFHFGGGQPMTEEQLRQDAELRTTRGRVWATEFVRWLFGAEHRTGYRVQ